MGAFWTFFAAAVVLGGFTGLCYFVAIWRLVKRGIHVKFLATPKDTFRVLRQYRNLAPENAWSLWPIYGYWLFLIPALCAGAAAALYFNSSPRSQNDLSVHLPTLGAALFWAACSSFLIALVFSYRAFHSEQRMKLRDWKRWISNEYIRNDVALAILGWAGFLLASLTLILRQGPTR
jgi:hypothetical protein